MLWHYLDCINFGRSYSTVTAQFKLYTHVQVHACACRLTCAKLQNLACARSVACDFGVCMRDNKHVQPTRDAHHELALTTRLV